MHIKWQNYQSVAALISPQETGVKNESVLDSARRED